MAVIREALYAIDVVAHRLRAIHRQLGQREHRSSDEAFPGPQRRFRRHRDSYAIGTVQDDQPAFRIGNAGNRLRLWRGRIMCHQIVFQMEGSGPARPLSIER